MAGKVPIARNMCSPVTSAAMDAPDQVSLAVYHASSMPIGTLCKHVFVRKIGLRLIVPSSPGTAILNASTVTGPLPTTVHHV